MMSGTTSEIRQNPYVGPRAFEESESQFFFGRTEEIEILAGLVKARQAVLFFAQSGAGKSSLLQAGLVPKLTKPKKIGRGRQVRTYQQMQVLPILSVGGVIPSGVHQPINNIYIFSALLTLLPSANPNELAIQTLTEGIASFFALTTDSGAVVATTQTPFSTPYQPTLNSKLPALLIFDQFEELFTHHLAHWSEREDFFQQINDALSTYRTLHVLFSMREDYIAELTPYASLLPEQLRSRFRMERLRKEAALQAVQQPAARAGCPFAKGVAEDLVDNLIGIKSDQESPITQAVTVEAYVEPVHLQIVCHQLWANLPPDHMAILAEDVREFGDVDQALIKFYEDTLEKVIQEPSLSLSERRLRIWFNERLITPALTRGLVYRGNKETVGLPNQAVDILYEAFIIRAVKRGDDTWYELAHDRLVTPILKANAAWQTTYYNPLAKATQAWLEADRTSRKLLRGAQLKEAKAYVEEHPEDVTETEEFFLAESIRGLNPLSTATQIWLEANRDPAKLLSGMQLEEAKVYAGENPEDVIEEEKEFLAASIRQDEFEREQAQQAATRRRNMIIAGIAVMIALTFLTILAFVQRSVAVAESHSAATAKVNAEAASIKAIEQKNTAEAARNEAALAEANAVAQKVAAEAERDKAATARADANWQKATAEAASTVAIQQQQAAEAERDKVAALADSLAALLPTETPTATPTEPPTATPTATPTGTFIPSPTDTPTASPTATPTVSPTPTANQTATVEAAQEQLAQVRATQTATAKPSFPPAGRIVFVSTRDGLIGDLYSMKGDGSDLQRLTTKNAFEPSYAEVNRHIIIAFASNRLRKVSGDERVTLFTMHLGDPEGTQIPDRGPDWDNWEPALSPDGRRVAFVSSRDNRWELYAMNIDGFGVERLTNNPARDWAPAWSPLGDKIAFTSERNGQADIWVMNVDGGDPVALTSHSAADEYPAWSPDGKQIAFASKRDGNFEIYVMDADGLNPRNLTNSLWEENFPAWSPDGKWLAFSRHINGNNEIIIMTIYGDNLINLTNNNADDWAPIWIPDAP